MPRSTGTPHNRAAGRTKGAVPPAGRSVEGMPSNPGKRNEALIDLLNYCRAAQRIAEAHGERFLGYLLAMAAQEGAEAADRRKAAELAGTPASPQAK